MLLTAVLNSVRLLVMVKFLLNLASALAPKDVYIFSYDPALVYKLYQLEEELLGGQGHASVHKFSAGTEAKSISKVLT